LIVAIIGVFAAWRGLKKRKEAQRKREGMKVDVIAWDGKSE